LRRFTPFRLEGVYVFRLQTLWSLANFKLNRLAFVQALITFGLDS